MACINEPITTQMTTYPTSQSTEGPKVKPIKEKLDIKHKLMTNQFPTKTTKNPSSKGHIISPFSRIKHLSMDIFEENN
jgi:hypothetical protein